MSAWVAGAVALVAAGFAYAAGRFARNGLEFTDLDLTEEPDGAGPVLAEQRAHCAVRPTDFVEVRDVRAQAFGPVVGVGAMEGASTAAIVLRAKDARRFAAAILNAADRADGFRPMFQTGGPSE